MAITFNIQKDGEEVSFEEIKHNFLALVLLEVIKENNRHIEELVDKESDSENESLTTERGNAAKCNIIICESLKHIALTAVEKKQ